MVFVKVRETYDLHTLKDKMSVIGIHTPSANIVKRNYPGLLLQCKAYRPFSCDVRLACASVLPLSATEVGTSSDDIAPEDVFNPILYKACSNFGMSQIDMYVNGASYDITGNTLDASNSGFDATDDFNLYYGLLAQTGEWKHANPQSGLEMRGLRPLVYETYQTVGDNALTGAENPMPLISPDDTMAGNYAVQTFRGSAHPLPMLNCTFARVQGSKTPYPDNYVPGFPEAPTNAQTGVPAPKIFCGVVLVPPSRLHTLFFRMVCEWTLEFSSIRSISDVTSWTGLKDLGNASHFMSYDYNNNKSDSVLTAQTDLVDTSADSGIKKVM